MHLFSIFSVDLSTMSKSIILIFQLHDGFRSQEWEMLWHMLPTSFSKKMDLCGSQVPLLLLQIVKEQANNSVWLLWWALLLKSCLIIFVQNIAVSDITVCSMCITMQVVILFSFYSFFCLSYMLFAGLFLQYILYMKCSLVR